VEGNEMKERNLKSTNGFLTFAIASSGMI